MFWYDLFNCLDIKIAEKPSKSKNIRVKKRCKFPNHFINLFAYCLYIMVIWNK